MVLAGVVYSNSPPSGILCTGGIFTFSMPKPYTIKATGPTTAAIYNLAIDSPIGSCSVSLLINQTSLGYFTIPKQFVSGTPADCEISGSFSSIDPNGSLHIQ
jgi:hypothetical protein